MSKQTQKNESKKDKFLDELRNIPGPEQSTDNVDQETGEVIDDGFTEETETLVAAAEFWQFADVPQKRIVGKPVFIGYYEKPFLREKDDMTDPAKPKLKGSVLGYLFKDVHGEFHIIGNSYQIDKALIGVVGFGDKIRIEYMGQGITAKGEKVNKFDVKRYVRKETPSQTNEDPTLNHSDDMPNDPAITDENDEPVQ